MLTRIDTFLNSTTMYRLVAYYLGVLLAVAGVLAYLHLLSFSVLDLAMSTGFLVAICWLFNALFALITGVPTNTESALITAFILALIFTPDFPDHSVEYLLLAAVAAMLSKYAISIRGRHVFNPAAFGAALSALALQQSATWWVGGSLYMLPFVIVGGLLIARKLRRYDMILAFLATVIAGNLIFAPLSLAGIQTTMNIMLIHSPLFFFAFVMLTEPLTAPPQRMERLICAIAVGILFAPWAHVGSLYFTPELALLAGNVLSYVLSPRYKSMLKLHDITKVAADTYEYAFEGRHPAFRPGQYAEWTIAVPKSDARGNRRYFTIASSPTEPNIHFGIKFYRPPSTFKFKIAGFQLGSAAMIGNIGGDFTLPKNTGRKLAFIAGGIGVTPFRSMVKYMTDMHEHRDTVLMFSNKKAGEIAYRDIFDGAAAANIGFRVIYTLTERPVPSDWKDEVGVLDAAMIQKHVPDYKERLFYLSGPHGMVDTFVHTLQAMGVSRFNIKTDYFPGFV